MLKSNELREGNWIKYHHGIFKVEPLTIFNVSNEPQFYEPIELTEEILLSIKDINKKIVNNKGLELTIYTINNIELLFTFGILRNIKFMNNKVIIYTAFRDFKLHDLQNLYFVLNGKELEINL